METKECNKKSNKTCRDHTKVNTDMTHARNKNNEYCRVQSSAAESLEPKPNSCHATKCATKLLKILAQKMTINEHGKTKKNENKA